MIERNGAIELGPRWEVVKDWLLVGAFRSVTAGGVWEGSTV
jgi:hypothetical protein